MSKITSDDLGKVFTYIDDHIDEHDKTIGAGDAAFGFWVRLLACTTTTETAPSSWFRRRLSPLVSMTFLSRAGLILTTTVTPIC